MRLTHLMLFATILLIGGAAMAQPPPPPIQFYGAIPLDSVHGRLDHMAADLQGDRLFVACLGNNSVEVIDIKKGYRLKTVSGLPGVQGVVYAPRVDRLVASCGGDGTCRILDGRTLDEIHKVNVGKDADNLRLDGATGKVWVGCESGALISFDPFTGAVDRHSEVRLTEHPEGFQLEPGSPRAYVNVPDAKQIVVVDREKGVQLTVWPLVGALDPVENFPISLDLQNRRLIVGCRKPARVAVWNADDGKLVASLPCGNDVDDVYWDSTRSWIYASCGSGFLYVLTKADADHYALLDSIPTGPGARTSLFIPERNLLFVAAPESGDYPAEILAYTLP